MIASAPSQLVSSFGNHLCGEWLPCLLHQELTHHLCCVLLYHAARPSSWSCTPDQISRYESHTQGQAGWAIRMCCVEKLRLCKHSIRAESGPSPCTHMRTCIELARLLQQDCQIWFPTKAATGYDSLVFAPHSTHVVAISMQHSHAQK
jgi:hypothetical protein